MILHNDRIWFEEWTTLICFQTHYTIWDREWNLVRIEGGEWRPRIEREAERCSWHGGRRSTTCFQTHKSYVCYCSLLSVTLFFPLPLIGVDTAVRRHHPPPAGRLDESDARTILRSTLPPSPDTTPTKWSIRLHVTDSELSEVAINTSRGDQVPKTECN